MNPEWKEKWITALRSGKYKQGKGQLRSLYDKFCCLGVLCDIVEPELWVRSDEACNYSMYSKSVNLPHEIKIKTGFSGDRDFNLIVMNDHGGSFSVIADYIEKEI